MLQNGYLLAKIGADTAENEQHFTENLPKIGNYPTGPLPYEHPAAAWQPGNISSKLNLPYFVLKRTLITLKYQEGWVTDFHGLRVPGPNKRRAGGRIRALTRAGAACTGPAPAQRWRACFNLDNIVASTACSLSLACKGGFSLCTNFMFIL